ncbi:hypothetical protein D9M68_892170 [compost metagenome]
MNGATLVRLYAAVATALMRWEPRLTLTRVRLYSADASGRAFLEIEGTTSESGDVVSTRVAIARGNP